MLLYLKCEVFDELTNLAYKEFASFEVFRVYYHSK